MPGLWARIRRLRNGQRDHRDLDDEFEFHLEAQVDDLVAAGWDRKEARREAVRRFGNPERVREETRRAHGLAPFDDLARNLRFAFRGLTRDPVFSTTFILTLGLTVGLGTLAFGVGRSALWSPPPYPASEQLAQVGLYRADQGINTNLLGIDGLTWERFRDGGDPFQRAVYSGWGAGVNLSTDAAAAYVIQQRVGTGYFETLGVPPARGREFTAAEDSPDGPAVAILSHGLWVQTFGADPDVLGGTVRLKGEAHTVVGIMPEGFRSPANADVWTPLRPSPSGEGSGTNYAIIARLPEGMTFDEANRRIAAITVPESWLERDAGYRFGMVELQESQTAGARTPVMVLLGSIGLMLLVGWANLAGLQIARTIGRRSELATRRALGSGSGPLVRQMAVENLLLGALGGGLGLGLSAVASSRIETLIHSRLGAWQPMPAFGEMAIAALVLTAIAFAVFAAAPIVRAARPGYGRMVVAGSRVLGRDRHTGRKVLLIGQMAMVTVLLFSAGLLGRSYSHLSGLEPGFEPEGVYSVQYSLDDARFSEDDAVQTLFRESLAELEQDPDVAIAAISLTLPYERPLNMAFRNPGDEQYRTTNVSYVSDDFFETLRIPLLRGRTFDDREATGTQVAAVVNQAFVDRYLEGRDPLGARIQMANGFGDLPVLGVVGNVQQSAGWGDNSRPVWETPTLYLRADQMPAAFFNGIHIWFAPSWIVRQAQGTGGVAGAVETAFQRVAPDLPVARTASLAEIMERAFRQQRFEATFLLVMAGLAVLLAGIGLYGMVSQEVLERRGEMGIRMALGASPGGAVVRTAMGGLAMAGIGLAIGLAASYYAGGLLENLIWGIGTLDPITILGMVAVLGALAAVASFVPATRIGRMDPSKILREE
ncbi:MAG: FtsX-like permease family protein [Gemmatimonadetes bacterium]|nr:FtsX-like permease family protein [Gemmatimonadota bacterium]